MGVGFSSSVTVTFKYQGRSAKWRAITPILDAWTCMQLCSGFRRKWSIIQLLFSSVLVHRCRETWIVRKISKQACMSFFCNSCNCIIAPDWIMLHSCFMFCSGFLFQSRIWILRSDPFTKSLPCKPRVLYTLFHSFVILTPLPATQGAYAQLVRVFKIPNGTVITGFVVDAEVRLPT